MSDTNINWYSLNQQFKVEEHGPVGLDEAVKIVDRYLARAAEKFQSAEEGIAASMFGFSRSKTEFIEFGVIGTDRTSYKFEVSDPSANWIKKLLGGVYQYKEELNSRQEVLQKVEEFFTTPVQEIKRRLQSQ